VIPDVPNRKSLPRMVWNRLTDDELGELMDQPRTDPSTIG
jgi:hypothetical protein